MECELGGADATTSARGSAKLLTARILRRHSIAHPRTAHARDGRVPPAFAGLVGADLLPASNGGWVVIEVNGAVEFTAEYSEWIDVREDGATPRE